ncbi:HNH endonuclease [Shewanella sp. HL-SH4]|uniref:HNH endonuclease n=1 Tax=Shewanella sp. HL-SH4 TaxID=3436240 RepID=UPI003EBA875E
MSTSSEDIFSIIANFNLVESNSSRTARWWTHIGLINAYERNPKARTACIAKLGAIFLVCGFDFEKTYGEIGKGFIHVHHKVDIATIGKSYQTKLLENIKAIY